MADTFTLELVTPARQVVNEAVSEAQIPVLGGYIGVLPGHTALLAEMGIGELSYHVGNRVFSCTAMGGFVEVLADRVIVLADSAERAEEIDVPRAEAALGRAQKRLRTPNDLHTDWKRAEESLKRAQVRLQVAAKAGRASTVAGSK
ncbi:MAG TPA: F0F1 ATP synthase subunit epsilon [Candidatus Acidoferrales bacterium]|jgi:F-type H+-transporting ATPase subunit epsilon|nr:F0F1 ATP synthase subunit epsilon [Candidatus Acidoferrales bacterium]